MKPIEFPEQTHVLAKDQPEYQPLPVRRLADGTTSSCWQLSEEDAERIYKALEGLEPGAELPRIFVTQLTFNKPLQPVMVSLDLPPDCFRALTEGAVIESTEPVAKPTAPDLPPATKLKLADIANCVGKSGPMLFGMDTETLPGMAICHFVRTETIHFKNDATFDATILPTLHPDNDSRLLHLAECFTGGLQESVVALCKTLLVVNEALSMVQHQAVLKPGTEAFVQDTRKLVVTALKAHGAI